MNKKFPAKLRLELPLALLLLAILVVVVIRIRLLTIPLERDEGEFAYAGQLMLQGIPPYKLFYNMKFPGIYAAYALIMAVFGESAAGIHFGLLLVDLICIWLLYRLARRFLDVPGAAVAAASYALLSTSPCVLGFAAHATHFVVAAALAGLLLLLRGEDSGKPVLFLGSGLMLGLSCLMKQPGAVFGLFGLCLLAARAVREREQWRMHLRRIVLFSIGLAMPLILTGLTLWRMGVFPRFWFWTVVYAKAHAAVIPWTEGWSDLMDVVRIYYINADGLFWIAGALGLASLVRRGIERRKKLWMAAFLVFSAVAVALSNFFTIHYFVMLLPALCLLAGQAFSSANQWMRSGNRGKTWVALPAGLFIGVWALTVFHHRERFFILTPDEVCRTIYGPNPFVEAGPIARYIREHSAPDARVAILGSEPEILFYAQRHSATGYIYMYDLVEKSQPYAKDMQREAIAQIEEARPEYLIFVRVAISWEAREFSHRAAKTALLAWLPKYTEGSYEEVGLVKVNESRSEYYWGKDASDLPEPAGPFVAIFKRK